MKLSRNLNFETNCKESIKIYYQIQQNLLQNITKTKTSLLQK